MIAEIRYWEIRTDVMVYKTKAHQASTALKRAGKTIDKDFLGGAIHSFVVIRIDKEEFDGMPEEELK